MLLLSSGEGTAVQSRPADCPSPPCTLQPLILSPRSNRAVVDPFKPYGPLPCVISVTACASRQGCVAAAINATVLVRLGAELHRVWNPSAMLRPHCTAVLCP